VLIENIKAINFDNSLMLGNLMEIERGKALSVGRHDVEHTVNSLLASRWKRDALAIDTENLRLKDAIISAKTQVPMHNIGHN
jgi:hypothetical protein